MSELISRQLLDLWNKYKPTIAVDAIEYDRELRQLLSTNLAEVGTDCISREQAIDALATMYCKSDEDGYVWIIRRDASARIDALPPAEPKRGKWIRDGHHIRCDQCGMYMCDTDREGDRIPTEFCPNCGADMRGDKNA